MGEVLLKKLVDKNLESPTHVVDDDYVARERSYHRCNLKELFHE